ncbi:PEK/GCN2 protein kinase [Gracilaria domingensis]|nr:PEK/GCN2 protein kinase [Gracilaria domingensis]
MDFSKATHAIVVCGHAVYLGGREISPIAATDPSEWALQTFQVQETSQFILHIRRGVELAASDPSSLLIFSGGQTRSPHFLSEAQGYHDLALVHRFWGFEQVASRTTTEEFSRDSFDNVLFGIGRFYECTGRFPSKLSIISWPFKRARFLFHVSSINWPLSRFVFEGVGKPSDEENAVRAESKTLQIFRNDAAGQGVVLGKKKQARNPYKRQNGYAVSCPLLTKVLEWNGVDELPPASVPWIMETKQEEN